MQRAPALLVLAALAVVLVSAHTYDFAAKEAEAKGRRGTEDWYSVFFDGVNYHVKPGIDKKNAVAYGYYTNDMMTTGWGTMSIITNPTFSDEMQMTGAGFLEGVLSQPEMWLIWVNTLNPLFNVSGNLTALPEAVQTFLTTNDEAVRAQIYANNATSIYWNQVGLIYCQLDGLVAGYQSVAPASQALDYYAILSLSANGDVGSVVQYINTTSEDTRPLMDWSRCSGFVKVTGDLRELFVGHTTWFSFQGMLRIYKAYTFNIKAAGTASVQIAFASYPGYLASTDDFYTTSSKLAVIETTNNNYNATQVLLINPAKGVLSWVRTQVANRMASSGEQWTQVFALQNSGTYNNQWMVVDYKLFTPHQALVANTLWVLEQNPDQIVAKDMTNTLAFGYWPSYNIPYFPDVYESAGYPRMASEYGDLFVYELAPRANILRRDQGTISRLEEFGSMMRYNDWQVDPLSLDNPSNAIASRFDLIKNSTATAQRNAFGGLDSKITSHKLIQTNAAMAESGPTHNQQPPFSWADWSHLAHYGMPTVFNFTFEYMEFPQEA